MSDALLWLLVVLSAPILVVSLVSLTYYPLALAFEASRRRPPVFDRPQPLVSVVVPAYNEERVLGNCVESILAATYPRKEVVLVDDGSTDATLLIMRRYAGQPNVTVVAQANGGKGSALNAGLARAAGEIVLFVDADGIFTQTTITDVLAGFVDPRVGAVCGNDEPVNLDRPQTHLLALLTHGTAFVRRALTRVNCLSIVSGNLGAFRRSALDEVGGFAEGIVGEDLELTWRVHRAGHRVNFRPRALVYAEVPSTPRALFKQRVRWTRGHIQTARRHRDMLGRGRYGAIGYYLPFNIVAMLLVPPLQLAALALIAALIATGDSPIGLTTVGAIGLIGLSAALLVTCFAIGLDRAWRDLRYLYVMPIWPLYSLIMSAVTVWALMLEARGRPAKWNKLARTGVVSRGAVSSKADA